MAMVCPRCGSGLSRHTFGAERLDGCHECGGLWLHCDELNRLIRDPDLLLDDVAAAFRRNLPDNALSGPMACPHCGAPLSPYRFHAVPDLPAHVCVDCRCVWLDEGGLRRIAERVAAARARSPVPAPPGPTPADPAPDPPAPSPPAEHIPAAPLESAPTVAYLVSATCPACDAANPPASTQCWSCGARLDTDSGKKRCWRCHVPLMDLAEGDLRFSLCEVCGGVWMEDGRLAVLLQLDGETFERLRADVAALREQARQRREREEAERLACEPYAVAAMRGTPSAASEAHARSLHADPRPSSASGRVPPSAPPHRGGGHGLLGLFRGRGADREHPRAVASHGAHDAPIAHPAADPEPPDKPAHPRCPACRYEMHPHEFGSTESVVACICAHCRAMWFDDGAVTAIYALVQREGMLSSRGSGSDMWARD